MRELTSFDDLKTVGGVLHKSFKAACYGRRLLGDDKEWHDAMEEASQWHHYTCSEAYLS